VLINRSSNLIRTSGNLNINNDLKFGHNKFQKCLQVCRQQDLFTRRTAGIFCGHENKLCVHSSVQEIISSILDISRVAKLNNRQKLRFLLDVKISTSDYSLYFIANALKF